MAVAHYERFLINNVQAISSAESTIRSMTWFLPGRFKDGELVSEGLSALLNTTSMYHDTLLAQVVQANPKYKALIPPSLHSRYTRAWSIKSDMYKWAARALELIRFTELLLEMALRRKVSPQNRWRGIVLLEVIKAGLRLLLLRITRKPLLQPPIPEREFDPTALPDIPQPSQSDEGSSSEGTPEHLKNNRELPHPLISPPPTRSATAVEDYLLPKALSTNSVKPSLSLLRSLSGPKEWTAEIIYVLRPLVYASLLASKKPSRALPAVLALEFITRSLRRNASPAAQLERQEYASRDKDMLWYLLRDSIWRDYTRPKLDAVAERTLRTPIVGLFGSLLKDWIPLIDEYYYYTAP
ncbi:peroxisome membrane protein [Cylindrobasidium torrendii FP15055 ss-10]|uniref:Peroxisomal membrane protein PEX16 n=1 Tax=Cylindrobasidium torrendii FP15055 ss-10 TaxID=1314674 RepID=A0A0D7B0P3_9AGAR|nr:peroxisome membrane protein [Cylindrobasidium torrendii FP15055 ss-10]